MPMAGEGALELHGANLPSYLHYNERKQRYHRARVSKPFEGNMGMPGGYQLE
jgi:hypothetical protein